MAKVCTPEDFKSCVNRLIGVFSCSPCVSTYETTTGFFNSDNVECEDGFFEDYDENFKFQMGEYKKVEHLTNKAPIHIQLIDYHNLTMFNKIMELNLLEVSDKKVVRNDICRIHVDEIIYKGDHKLTLNNDFFEGWKYSDMKTYKDNKKKGEHLYVKIEKGKTTFDLKNSNMNYIHAALAGSGKS